MMTNISEEKRNKQVAEYWSWVAKRGELGFWDVPGWREHQNILASGLETESWLDVFSKKVAEDTNYVPGTALSLGCGSGSQELQLIEQGLANDVEGCDISADLIKFAQKEADKRNAPLKYYVCNLNQPRFPKNRYSLVFAGGILHHIENLENLFFSVRDALAPNGVFMIYDYVGPTRFQWSKSQIEEGNRLLKELPWTYRWKRGYPWYYTVSRLLFNSLPIFKMKKCESFLRKLLPQRIFAQYLRLKTARLLLKQIIPPPIEQFEVTDPSEAIRSGDILPTLSKYFTIESQLSQGGTLAQPIFNRTAANFMVNKKGASLARKIFEYERQLISDNIIESDFQALLLKPKP